MHKGEEAGCVLQLFSWSPPSAAAVASTVAIAVEVVPNRPKLNLTSVVDQFSANCCDVPASVAIDRHLGNTVTSVAVAVDQRRRAI